MTLETMRQCDLLLGDYEEDDITDRVDDDFIAYDSENDFSENDNDIIAQEPSFHNDTVEHGQDEEEEWDGPFTQPDPVSPAIVPPAPVNGLTSTYITPVLAGYLLDYSLALHLLPSYFQVVFHDQLQIWLSDGVTVIKASLAPDLLEELAGVRLLHLVLSVEESTGHAGPGDLALVSFSRSCPA